LAARASVAAHLSPELAAPLEDLGGGALLTPALRLVLARQAVARGDLETARRRIEALRPGRDRDALAGQVEELLGHRDAAIRYFLAAGDLAGLERESKAIEAAGDSHGAVLLQREIVRRLAADPTERDDLADAWWRLGYLEQNDGYHHYPISSRRPWVVRSLDAYAHAVALAPLAERYLVSAGNESLNLGDVRRAERYFMRAREADQTSALPYVGLAEVAVRRRDFAAARRFYARAARIAPDAPAVVRLRAELP
jgi:tetratricopeptide (TPR) repeat protein